MKEAGENLYCSDMEDWIKKITSLKNITSLERENISKKDRAFVQKNYSDEVLDKVWEQIFERVISLEKI